MMSAQPSPGSDQAAASDPVVVIGGGFAGLSAAAALAERGMRVLVARRAAQLGGRATAFTDRETGELVDNGQHVLFGCYRETFEFLAADRRARQRPRCSRRWKCRIFDRRRTPIGAQLPGAALPAASSRRRARLGRDAVARSAGGRSSWRDRCGGRAANCSAPATVSAEPDGTVSDWLVRARPARQLRAWLWEPLAVAALNQSPDVAAAAPFVRVLAEMFGPDPAASALVLPTRPLHQMYAEPARALHRGARRGGPRQRAGAGCRGARTRAGSRCPRRPHRHAAASSPPSRGSRCAACSPAHRRRRLAPIVGGRRRHGSRCRSSP